jgi:RNA polymerase sigma factor (sigma-70 family)
MRGCWFCVPVLQVTEDHVRRALMIARWYGRRARRAEISDLESAALEGLAKAARDFDPDKRARGGRADGPKRSFWTFAFKRIVGEMKDELRRFDHLTRGQRALIGEDESGEPFVRDQSVNWLNPRNPLPLDSGAVLDTIEEPHNPIEEFELRDAFCRATAALPDRERFVLVKRELEGYSNVEIAEAFAVTEGRTSQLRGAALEHVREEIGDSFTDSS